MRVSQWAAIAMALGLALIPAGVVLTGEYEDVVFDDTLCPDCGLGKLTESELLHLIGAVRSLDGRSYLEMSAFQYLRENDWRPTDVIGYRLYQPNPHFSGTKVLVVIRDGSLSLLEPFGITERLDPGTYWTKISGSRWELLLPDGDTNDYWHKETL